MRYPNGFPGWVDLSTPDVDAAKAYYGELLGWTFEDVPTDMGPPYTMCSLDGDVVAGMGPLPPGQQEPGMPPVWTTYVIVGDLDEVVAAAPGAGGSVVMPGMDVMTSGRMAMLGDPSGAVLGLWQPQEHQGADRFNVHGTVGWNELQTRDPAAAMPFYEELFGWRWERTDGAEGSDYFIARLDAKQSEDTSIGGLLPMPAEVPTEVPSFWSVYFVVDDLQAALATSSRLAGTAVTDVMGGGGMTFAMAEDPQGAVFALVTFDAE